MSINEARTFHHEGGTNLAYEAGISGRMAQLCADHWADKLYIPREVLECAAANPENGWRIDLVGNKWHWYTDGPEVVIILNEKELDPLPRKFWERTLLLVQ